MLAFYRENMRWLIGGFLLTTFSGFGQTFFISIWGAEIRAEFNLTHGGFGLIYMIATLASALTLPFVGRLVDVISVARCTMLVIVTLAAAAALMSFANSLVVLVLSIYLLRLFGQGMMTHTAITAIGRWYAQNRGKAVSVVTIGHQFSEALAPAVFVAIAAVVGWRSSWLVAAGMLLVVALPAIVLLMRVERIPRSKAAADSQSLEQGRQWTRAEVMRDPLFWKAGIGIFAPPFIGTSIFFHQDYLIELNGWDRWQYDASFAVMAVVTVVMSLITGVAIDRFSAVRLLPSFMIPLGFACWVLGSFSAPAAIFVFMILLGLSYGITSTLFGAIWPEVYGIRHLGGIRAITVSLMVFMSAAGPGATGLLIDLGVPFKTQLIYIGVFCFASVLVMLSSSRGYRMRHTGVQT